MINNFQMTNIKAWNINWSRLL